MNFENRSAIKTKLLKDAAREWSYQYGTEIDIDHVDPVVDLLFGACSYEFEKVNHEILNSRNRVFEQLLEVLTPQELIGPTPAYTVVHANPIEEVQVSSKYDVFAIKNIATNSEYLFSPVDKYLIYDLHIEALVSSTQIKKIGERGEPEVIVKSNYATEFPKNQIYLGLKINPLISELEHLNFYIDWGESDLGLEFKRHLHQSIWSINGEAVNVKRGIKRYEGNHVTDGQQSYSKEYENIDFIHIGDKIDSIHKCKSTPPAIVLETYNEAIVSKWGDELIWVKIEFPISFGKYLDNCMIYTNCFPAINKRCIEKHEKIQKGNNLIALDTSIGYFLNVDFIGIDDQPFTELREKTINNFENTYYIRKSGVNKFDQRDAYQSLSYTMDLLKDETTAFNSLGYHNISNDLIEVDQILKRINKNLLALNKAKEDLVYVHIFPKDDQASVLIKYWITDADGVNKINAYSPLKVGNTTSYSTSKCYLLTDIRSGKKPPSQTEIINLFKSSIISHQRIVSKEDIIIFSRSFIGQENIKSIEIKQEVTLGKANFGGLQNQVVVEIQVMPFVEISDNKFKDLEIQLNQKSIASTLIIVKRVQK
jgi:hypothetical protein